MHGASRRPPALRRCFVRDLSHHSTRVAASQWWCSAAATARSNSSHAAWMHRFFRQHPRSCKRQPPAGRRRGRPDPTGLLQRRAKIAGRSRSARSDRRRRDGPGRRRRGGRRGERPPLDGGYAGAEADRRRLACTGCSWLVGRAGPGWAAPRYNQLFKAYEQNRNLSNVVMGTIPRIALRRSAARVEQRNLFKFYAPSCHDASEASSL